MARDHRPDPRHHTRVVVGVRSGRLHPGHQRAAVPPICGGRLGIHADLGAQRTDVEPGALRRAPQAGQRSSGPMRYVLRAIDRCPRRLCGGGTPAGARIASSGSWSWPARWPRRSGCSARPRRASCPTRTRAQFFAALRLPEGVSLNRTEAVVKQVEEHRQADPGRRRRAVGGRTQFHRLCPIVEPGFLRHPAQALRDAYRSGAERRRDHCASAAADGRHPGRHRVPVQPAAHSRSRKHGRFPIRAGGAAGPVAV